MRNLSQPFFNILLVAALSVGSILPVYPQQLAYSGHIPLQKHQDEQSTLWSALEALESQYDVHFTYQSDLVENKLIEPIASPSPDNLEEQLNQLLQPFRLLHRRVDKGYYLIYPEVPPLDTHSLERLTIQPGQGDTLAFTRLFASPRAALLKRGSLRRKAVEKTVSGRVTDASTGEGLPGVNILAKGTTTGTVTDIEGNYTLTLADEVETLIFSSIGYKKQEILLSGQARFDISLEPDVAALDEIVITSFGIAKTEKEVVYATQEVKGEDLAQVGNPNVLNGLQGKVAGVSVSLNSGMPGRSPSVKIRGSRSITGNNQPLYVVDGAPISGNIQDINPSSIESMNVLKGSAASALYGLRASNGVIIITTKTGKAREGKPVVNVETFYSVDNVSYLPDLQTEFAQGGNGDFNPNGPFSWGPRISTLGTYTNQQGEQETARSYDNDKAFYQAGHTFNTNVSVSNSGEIGSYTVGVGHNVQKGIVPGTDLRRTNLNFNSRLKISDRFTTSVFFNYSDYSANDYPDLAGNDNYFRSLSDVPPSFNLAGKPFASEADPFFQQYFRASQNNPYWVVNNNYRTTSRPRTIGNITLAYDLTDALQLNYRLGVDNYTSRAEDFRELGTGQAGRTNPPSGGSLSIVNDRLNQINSNFFATYKKQLGENFMLDAIVGNEIYDQRTNRETTGGSNFVAGGWANLANATVLQSDNFTSRQRIVGFYGNVNLGWQDKVFLNASGRNDYVSNMPSGNRSFFYPSLGASAIITNLFPELADVMSFGKLRATVAEVGQAGPIFVNGTGFVSRNPAAFNFPFNGVASFTQQSTRINPNLEPENTRSFEIGADLRFFDDRVSVDYTYFSSKSEGQIFDVPLPLSSGASSEIRNGGEIASSGHEIILGLIPVQKPDFVWNITTNFTVINNEVVDLAEGVDRIGITRVNGSDIIVAEKGADFPSILAFSYLKDPASGQDIIQSNPDAAGYGFPILGPELGVVESPLPDFEVNFINTVSYKDLSLSVQLDWRSGGQLFSYSYIETRWRGTAGVTRDREVEEVLPGVKGTVENGNLVVEGANDIAVKKDFAYYNTIGAFRPTEQSLQDASFVRLREVRLNYDLPSTLLDQTFFTSASVYFTGRNLFLLTDSFTDPEVNYSDGQSNNSAGLELSQIPQTRSLGAGLRLTF